MIQLTKAVASALDMNAYVHWDDYDNAVTDAALAAAQREVSLTNQSDVAQPNYVTTSWLNQTMSNHQTRQGTVSAAINQTQNSLAMEAYIRHFDNSSICSVFSPITPYVADWIGSVATFRELVRWSNTDSAESVASKLMALPPGTLGYLYQLPDIDMQSVEVLGTLLDGSNIVLVDHRHLLELALSKLHI